MANDHYTLPEVAGLLNKNARQIRYMVQTGQLPGSKVGGRWVVKKSDLGLTPTAPQQQAVAAVEQVAETERRQRRYSVQDLRAFQRGEGLYREMVEGLGAEHPTVVRVREALEALTLGCHAFEADEKLEQFRRVRRTLATGVAELLLAPAGPSAAERAFAERLEQDVMPHVSGLIRAADRKRSSDRFRRFSAGRR